MSYVTKDSGAREEYASGMVRDTQEGKPRYDLVDRPMLKRWAELMGRGAEKYGEDNWRLAASHDELRRFKASAFRHFMQWLDGERDEDHAAAVFFNIAAAEDLEARLDVLSYTAHTLYTGRLENSSEGQYQYDPETGTAEIC